MKVVASNLSTIIIGGLLIVQSAEASSCTWDCTSAEANTYHGGAVTFTDGAVFGCKWIGTGCGQPDCFDVTDPSTLFPVVFAEPYGGVRINAQAESVTLSSTDGDLTATISTNKADYDDGEYDKIYSWDTSFNVELVICKAGAVNSVEYPFLVYKYDVAATLSDHQLTCPEGKAVSHTDFCGTLEDVTTTNDDPTTTTCDLVCNSPPGNAADYLGCAEISPAGQCLETCDESQYACVLQGTQYCGYPCTVKPVDTQCRSAVGDCDLEEVCDGVGAECPNDVRRGNDYVCRPVLNRLCDVEERCDGTIAHCPTDHVKEAGVLCRDSAGDCDEQELCDGSDPECPVDVFSPSTEVCRPVDDFAGSCDKAELCTGAGPHCPADGGLSTGIVYKCGLDHYLTGGIDSTDLFSGNVRSGSLYFADDAECNIGANKRTVVNEDPDSDSLTADGGCAPALCPNGKGLSNAVGGVCAYDSGKWEWTCSGKLENGKDQVDLCPV